MENPPLIQGRQIRIFQLQTVQEIGSRSIDPAIAKARGRIFKTTCGLLAASPSVVNAVACAREIQTRLAKRNSELPPDRRLLFRIGVSIGDVVAATDEHGGDALHGDGVNQAARPGALADPGRPCISVGECGGFRASDLCAG